MRLLQHLELNRRAGDRPRFAREALEPALRWPMSLARAKAFFK